MDIFEKCKRIPIADEAKAAGIYPYFHSLTSRQDTSVQMSGRQVIMLGSNNYLGLTSHPEVTEAGKRALDKYGSGCSFSRSSYSTSCISASRFSISRSSLLSCAFA